MSKTGTTLNWGNAVRAVQEVLKIIQEEVGTTPEEGMFVINRLAEGGFLNESLEEVTLKYTFLEAEEKRWGVIEYLIENHGMRQREADEIVESLIREGFLR